MGLDMSVYKYNKKYNEEELRKVKLAKRYSYNKIDEMKKHLEDHKNLSEEQYIRKYISSYYVDRIYPSKEEIDRIINEHPETGAEFIKQDSEMLLEQTREDIKEHLNEITEFLNLSKEFIEEVDNLEPIEIAYWRKHSDLNGYMEELYRKKGGTKDFNCVPLYLSKEDVEQIIVDHKKHLDKDDDFTIGASRGFFWGSTEEQDWKNSLNDFEEILENTDWDNETVYYSCWW